jgi:hypothetical protein
VGLDEAADEDDGFDDNAASVFGGVDGADDMPIDA